MTSETDLAATEKLIEILCADLRQSWLDGKEVPCEDFLRQHPQFNSNTEALFELAYSEYVVAQELGHQPAPDAYCQRFPKVAARLQRQIEFRRAFEAGLPEDIPVQPQSRRPRLKPLSSLERIGRFRIEKELGRGGFGVVFLAFDESLKRQVALKVPRAELLTNEIHERFLREAEMAAALDHPNIVPVFEAGEEDGISFIASAYCPGEDLAQRLARKDDPLSIRQSAGLIARIAEAMQHAHNRGVVHRDLKPSNVLLVPRDGHTAEEDLPFVARVTDFGLARLMEQQMKETHSSVMLGTPFYMAPEQIQSNMLEEQFAAVDIYSLGVILYELLTGKRPFEGETIMEILDRVRAGEPVSLCEVRKDIPRDLETICLKCLQTSPNDRYASCADLAADLWRFLRGEPVSATRTGLWSLFQRWRRHPQRIRDAGTMSIVLGLGVPLWIIGSISLLAYEQVPLNIRNEILPQWMLLTFGLFLPLAWCGRQAIRRRQVYLRAGGILAVISVVTCLPPLLGSPILIFKDLYDGNPQARIVVYSMLITLFTVQSLLYGNALWLTRGDSAKGPSI